MDCYDDNRVLKNFQKTEVYSRIVGYIRPVDQWNVGKSEEWKDRKTFACESGQ
jgi:anaerobic ribonucleoside-triphosphate reductase